MELVQVEVIVFGRCSNSAHLFLIKNLSERQKSVSDTRFHLRHSLMTLKWRPEIETRVSLLLCCLAAFYLPLVQKTLIRLGKKGINLLTTKEVPTKYQVIIDSSGESGDLELIGYGLKSVKKITLSTNTTPIWDLMRPLVSKNLMALKGHENVTKITSYESHENATNWHWDFEHKVS